ncbi:MAG: hypothetical protein GY801_49790 [bacterium]|nr:hypothetical protein [bacterium]
MDLTMSLTAEHLQIASILDQATKRIIANGGDDMVIIRDMAEYMDGFKQLMDTTSPAEMDELCSRFDEFYRYAKVLEALAKGIASGEIDVP